MIIAETAIAALEQAIALPRYGHIDDQTLAVFLIDFGSDRHLHDRIGAAGAGHHLAFAAFTALGLHMLLETVVDQGVEIFHRLRDHIAAAPAVTAIGPAIFDKFLTSKGDAAVATGSAGCIHLCDVEKLHVSPI